MSSTVVASASSMPTEEQMHYLATIRYVTSRSEGLKIWGALSSYMGYEIMGEGDMHALACIRYSGKRDNYVISVRKEALECTDTMLIPQSNLLKHELLHFICGHLKIQNVEAWERRWPHQIINIAADLVVHQYCDAEEIEKLFAITPGMNDSKLYTVDRLGFPRNLIVPEYCELLMNIAEIVAIGSDNDDEGDESDPCAFIPARVDVRGGDPDSAARRIISRSSSAVKDPNLERSRSLLPSSASQFIDSLMQPPQVDFGSMFRQYMSAYGKSHRLVSKRRPSRRHPDFFGRIRRAGTRIVVAIDTSGSMGVEDLRLIRSELEYASSYGATIDVMHVDAKVAHGPEEYTGELSEFFGRGGTDFSPAFNAIEQKELTYSFMVYFTDGYGSAPKEEPMPTLWALVPQGMDEKTFRETVCPWGNVFKMKLEE